MKTVMFVMMISSSAFAADLSTYLDQQLTMMEKSGAKQLPAASKVESEQDSMFFLKRFWLRVRPRAVFSLPGLVKIQIVPEVEMLWERPTPEGWTGYKR